MGPTRGIEPRTPSSSARRSTDELNRDKMEEGVRIELTHASRRGTVFETAEPHGPQPSVKLAEGSELESLQPFG